MLAPLQADKFGWYMSKYFFYIFGLLCFICSVRFLQLFDNFIVMKLWLVLFVLYNFVFLWFVLCSKFCVRFLFFFASILLVINLFLVDFVGYSISEPVTLSSYPTLKPGDIVVTRRFNLNLERGQMVTVLVDGKKYMKRIHGIPHDEIITCNGYVYVNGYHYSLLNGWKGKKYNSKGNYCYQGVSKFTIDSNSFFVLGDNIHDSYDSRNFGTVSMANITGNQVYVVSGGVNGTAVDLTVKFE